MDTLEFSPMRVLDRYIVKTLLAAVAVVAVVVLVLVGLFMFIAQQGEVGTGAYTTAKALRYVLLNLPDQLFQYLPVIAIIGSLTGLGALARGSELTVMRAAGVSMLRIGGAVAQAGVLLVLLAVALSEYVAPELGRLSREQKALAKFADISFAGEGGAWVRDGNRLLQIERQSAQGDFGGLRVFELTASADLASVAHAARATQLDEGRWVLHEHVQSRFEGDRVVMSHDAQRQLDTRISAGFLGLASADRTQMSLRALGSLVSYLRSNGQDAHSYEFSLWSRTARIVAVFFAVLLALPFVFGSLRASGAGARATLGLVLGLGYFLLQQMVESGTLAFALPPLLLAWVPTAVLAVVVSVLVARLH